MWARIARRTAPTASVAAANASAGVCCSLATWNRSRTRSGGALTLAVLYTVMAHLVRPALSARAREHRRGARVVEVDGAKLFFPKERPERLTVQLRRHWAR